MPLVDIFRYVVAYDAIVSVKSIRKMRPHLGGNLVPNVQKLTEVQIVLLA